MHNKTSWSVKRLAFLSLIWLTGCTSPMALKTDYMSFSRALADANNKQLLLNMARLANHDPCQLLQLELKVQFPGSIYAGSGCFPSICE